MSNFLQKFIYASPFIGRLVGYFYIKIQFKLLEFYKDKQIVDLIKTIKDEVNFAFYPYEAYHLYSIVKAQSNLEGEMAEVGVYQGGSSKIICETKGDRKLHLFDTFQGLPEISEKDTTFGKKLWEKDLCNDTSLEIVKNYLSVYKNVYFYQGEFPGTSTPVTDSKFSFVHLDVDLYKSTKDCLAFFYPRLINGGVILTHDYHGTGVRSAFDEFFLDKNVSVIELTGPQCMVIKQF
jgi:hypothetical protein